MKKYLLSLTTLALLLCEASFPGGMAFAATTYTLSADHKTLTITSSGAMDNLTSSNYTTRGWNSYATTITKIIINNTVTAIGDYAFKGMTSVTTVTFNSTSKVATIGQYAFDGCSGITSFSLPNSLTTIGYYAFQGCTGISSITIPKNVTICGEQAFTGCSNLTTVNWNAVNCTEYKSGSQFSSSWGPFYNGTIKNQITTFKFGSDVTVIPPFICYGFKNLSEIKIPAKVTTIGAGAFQNCTTAVAVEIPLSVETIGANAFNGCTGLTKIFSRPTTPPTASANTFTGVTTTIPVTVTSSAAATSYAGATGWDVFKNYTTTRSGSCGASANWELNYATGTFAITGSGATTDYGAYGDVPWIQDTSFIYTASVANAITRLGNRTFYGCERLTKISISSSQLTSIGQYAMYKCTSLKGFGNSTIQINIPASVVTIDNYAFQLCSAATKVYMMSTAELTTIGDGAFDKMSSLTDVAIYNCTHLNAINSYAFRDCSSLASITLPASVTSIGSSVFSGCSALTPEGGSVNYKGTIDQWASIAFSGSNSNPASLTQLLKINGTPVTSCTISVPVKNYAFYNNKALTDVTLTDGCTSLGNSAFYGCSNWGGTVIIPSALTAINQYAFQNCSSLTGVDLLHADALTTIGVSAFWGASLAGELYIPAAVTSVAGSAFRDITGFTAIYASPTTAPSDINNYTFNITTKTIPFYVATPSALTSYSGASYWNAFTNMKVGGYCGATGNETGVKWEFNTTSGLLTISGSGAMKDYANSSSNRSPWYSFASSVTSIKICDGVTHVGKFAFHTCSNATEVWMSTTVTECGNSAFLGCSSLNNVKYGKTSTPTLSYATGWAQIDFGNYSANPLSFAHTLQVYKATSTMPAWGTVIGFENRNIDQIKKFAFYGCTSLTSAVLPTIVDTIEESAFYGCTNLATVTLPDALTTIGKEAFKNCSTLTSITIPENVTKMICHSGSTTYSIFGGCANLTTIVWNARNCASDYIKVGTGSGYNYGTPFSGIYSQITSITFGENVDSIPNYLCYHMDHLTSVTIPASVTNIGTEAFDACTNLDSVICEGTTPPTLASGAFSSPSTKKLYLQHDIDVKAAYRAASGWNSFTEANTFPKIVQFDMNGQTGDAIDPQFFDNITSKASAPSDPADVNYHSFSSWYENPEGTGSEFAFSTTNITEDKTLYAKWTIYNYQVTFDLQGHGSAIASQTIDHNGLVSEPSAPSETGYTFGGWFKEPGCVNEWDFSNDHVTTTTTLYALWTINSYDVTFDLQGHGDAIDAQSINYNGLVSKPSAPSETGYTFGGWYKEAGCSNAWNFSTDHVTAATTLFAKWTINSYDVTFDLQGHGDAIDAQSINYNGLVSQPSAPSADYYTFGGWYKEPACSNVWDFSEDRISEATTLYAKWTRADLTLNDNADNSDALTEYDDETTNVHLTRTIISASFNTLCLPFAMTAGQVETYFGAECDIEELTRASYADGDLKLFFTKRTAIEAGKPYLIKPQADVANPTIADVTIDSTARPIVFEGVTFTGTFSPTVLANSEDLLFLGASNTLYMSSGGTMKGMRGYFQLTTPQAQAAARRSARIVFHEEVATGIETVESQESKVESTKIMRDGQLLIIRDGKTYNAQGALIK